MPIHDWTRVSAGVYHDMHVALVVELSRTLNMRALPGSHYALIELASRLPMPGLLTPDELRAPLVAQGFGVGDMYRNSEAALLTLKRNRIVIHRTTDDRVVALLEIIAPGNKAGSGPLQVLIDKAVAALQQGYHLLMIDLFPPGPADPRGLHDRVWRELEGGPFEPPAGKPLTLAAYRAAEGITAYVEPIAVGQDLPDMPLFLDPDHYVNVPLESTYRAAYEGVPRRWRQVIESAPPASR